MSVINLLSEPEAVDELGVGIIQRRFFRIFSSLVLLSDEQNTF